VLAVADLAADPLTGQCGVPPDHNPGQLLGNPICTIHSQQPRGTPSHH
jgi:hypothetical protein